MSFVPMVVEQGSSASASAIQTNRRDRTESAGTPRTNSMSATIRRTNMVKLTQDPIDHSQITDSVRSNQAGAVLLFLGSVREMTGDRQTLALDYEAHGDMAVAKMEELRSEALTRWPLTSVAIVHRTGHMELGEISVAIAVSSPHRCDAFAAGQFLIDTLKEVVPIWKKENWADGTTEWVHPGAEAGKTAEKASDA